MAGWSNQSGIGVVNRNWPEGVSLFVFSTSTYDWKSEELFALQGEIAQLVAAEIDAVIIPKE